MRVLVYIGSNDKNSINAANERLEKGDDVTIVSCDNALGICRDNYFGNRPFCSICMRSNANLWKKDFIKKGADVLYLSRLITEEDKKTASNYIFKYDNVKELKNVIYKDVEIGFGAFSTYVSVTGNVTPEFNKNLKRYLNVLMRKEIEVINVLDRVIEEIHPELIILHNGRFAEFKPALGLAQRHMINYITTEEVYYQDKILKNNFYNDVVHSITANYQKYIKNWESSNQTEEEKIKIGKSFFEKRRNKITTGGKVYTANQQKELLPEDIPSDKEIISIFNSSEDEFCAVSTEYDSYMLFDNQYVALKTIFDHYKDDKKKHFYLRIHPRLQGYHFKSHTLLYELEYENVTIIPPTSTVDSYALMDVSAKIVVFNSTMGVESSYWGKPVIELSKYMWSLMDVVYTPETVEELWQLIDTPNLKCKSNDNCLKYAYWELHPNYEEVKYVTNENVDINFLGTNIHQEHMFLKICGSVKLNSILRIILTRPFVMKLLMPFTYFTELPGKNE